MKSSPMTPTGQKPGPYQRYPMVMHRGAESRHATSAEEEEAAIEAGWSSVRPPPPAPEPDKPSVEDRLASLEEWRASHKGKR